MGKRDKSPATSGSSSTELVEADEENGGGFFGLFSVCKDKASKSDGPVA